MTQEEKAKAYDEALKRARKQRDDYQKELDKTDKNSQLAGILRAGISAIELAFPELKESEDERIRKAALEGIEYLEHELCWDAIGDIDILDVKEYLEKQKESLHISETCKDVIVAIEKYLDWLTGYPDYSPKGKYSIQDMLHCLYVIEKQKEQNSKDEECTDFTIYHPLKNGNGKYECIPYSFYGSLTSFSEDKDLIDFLRTCFYTEEECDKWIEQQEEQKPVQSEKEREYVKTLKGLVSDFIHNSGGSIVDTAYYQQICDWLDGRHVEQKPAEWSEEDDIGWDEAFACVTRAEKAAKNEEELQNAVTAEKWLKEIKFKYCVHSVKQEWSEEDETCLEDALWCVMKTRHFVAKDACDLDACRCAEKWLKSLPLRCPKSTDNWKPSEEQMEAFKGYIEDFQARAEAAIGGWNNFDAMIRLYQQLKKLK